MKKIDLPYEQQTPAQRWALICTQEKEKRYWVRRQMAEHFGVVTSTVTFWEQGKSYPKNEFIYMMANLMQVSPTYLINWLNNTPNEQDLPQKSFVDRTLHEAESLTDTETADLITALVALLVTKKKQETKQLSIKF